MPNLLLGFYASAIPAFTYDVLVIAGGGGGGGYVGSGAGAGGISYLANKSQSLGSVINLTIGAGGAGGDNARGSIGIDSTFGSITSNGGGTGAYHDSSVGGNGGSGGGGTRGSAFNGAAGSDHT